MLLPPSPDDLRATARTVGRVLVVLGCGTGVLAVIALVSGDVDTATALACGAGPALVLGTLGRTVPTRHRRLTWTRGVVSAVASLLVGSIVATIPLWLSGHYAGWVDALFDAVSGLTTTGLTIVGDLDHLPRPLVLYRSLLEVLGGVGFLVVAVSLLRSRAMLASSMEVGAGGQERIMRSPTRLWEEVRLVVTTLLGVGVVASLVALATAGLPLGSLVTTATALVVAATTTGGFTPLTGSVGVYHSMAVEAVLVALMLGGALSVWVHLHADRPSLLRRELDLRVFVATLVLVVAGTVVGLAQAGTFDQVIALVRHGGFLAVAAVTTTGLSSITPRLIGTDFGAMATTALFLGMAVGGMSGSMASGSKALRVGLLAHGIRHEVARILGPADAVHATWFVDHGRRERLTDAHVRSAATVLLLTLAAIPMAAVALLWSDPSVGLAQAVFTATSVISNVGLEMQAFRATDPMLTKLLATGLMVLGRFEWLAVFAFVGTVVAFVRDRPRRRRDRAVSRTVSRAVSRAGHRRGRRGDRLPTTHDPNGGTP